MWGRKAAAASLTTSEFPEALRTALSVSVRASSLSPARSEDRRGSAGHGSRSSVGSPAGPSEVRAVPGSSAQHSNPTNTVSPARSLVWRPTHSGPMSRSGCRIHRLPRVSGTFQVYRRSIRVSRNRDTVRLSRPFAIAHTCLMPPPPTGHLRVYVFNSVGPLRGHRWQDVPDTPRVRGWIDAGHLSLTGPFFDEPPVDLPARRCCGAR